MENIHVCKIDFIIYFQLILQLAQERDCSMPPTHGIAQSPTGSPGMQRTESRQHLSVELADTKAKLRRIRQEM